ncbi:hypothetical protein INT08_06585 [Prosthecochloris sp. N3]|uniref:Uncharacterized protein n=1 Tax=Prosthecochloris ethylica TaxID=2743976 RepID=A0ABR9XSD5_9CHLB|nr:hypothetical protein [Prosthecochloris ethylica]MBF0585303.1 hypothetical protein [Prosthecochloris ethylica]MBF0636839.1 hypothetical protein [Prosthecochloris ethylica]NUK46532.1 hypothetical protein [Prosthecochloris ethylica]
MITLPKALVDKFNDWLGREGVDTPFLNESELFADELAAKVCKAIAEAASESL